MNFVNRAIISIKRRPGKTVILLLLVFILGNIISGTISVGQAIENTDANLRRNLPAVATLEEDWEARWEHENRNGEWVESERLTPEIIREIGELPYVASFEYSATGGLYSKELVKFALPDSEYDMGDNLAREGVEGVELFELKGVHNPEVLDIQAELVTLVTGRTFTEQEVNHFNQVNSVAIISQTLADLNNLTIGSTFTLDNTIYDQLGIEAFNYSDIFSEDNVLVRESYEFEVIGIIEPTSRPSTGDEWEDERRELELANRIYVPNVVIETATAFRFEQEWELGFYEGMSESELEFEDWLWYQNVFLLNDPMELEDFAQAAAEILPDFWVVNDLSNTFANIATSMETLQWLSSLILWIAVGATLLILSLLITLFLRDRKYEMGVYLALGERKIKVILQIILEVVATGVVAVTLALFTGSLLASNISETMLRQDLISRQQEDPWGSVMAAESEALRWFSPGELSVEEMLASYDLSLNAATITLFYSVGIGTLLVSTVIPILYITRLNPKKIMM